MEYQFINLKKIFSEKATRDFYSAIKKSKNIIEKSNLSEEDKRKRYQEMDNFKKAYENAKRNYNKMNKEETGVIKMRCIINKKCIKSLEERVVWFNEIIINTIESNKGDYRRVIFAN